jgi:2-C-methyl-D-erythritol 4-phosphate cytidylyltransferase
MPRPRPQVKAQESTKVGAIIVAGGSGERFGRGRPKQFVKLAGKPVIDHAVDGIAASGLVDFIVAVIPPGFKGYKRNPRINFIAPGGKTRQESVLKGLLACPPTTDIIIIQDAVRPFISTDVIKKCLAALKRFQGVAAAVPSIDTLVEVRGRKIVGVPDRGKIFRNQTPQVFRYEDILRAHKKLRSRNFTDDITLAVEAGLKCGVVEGAEANLKITYSADLAIAERILRI